MPIKKTKVKVGLKSLAMLSSYFNYIFMRPRQKPRLRPEISPKFLSSLGPNLARTRPKPKPGPNPNPTQKARPDLQL